MNDGSAFSRRDWATIAAIFFVSLVLRIPFRSQLAYHWDSAEFVLAVREYNVALSQPHAPGYFLYVMLGRLTNLIVGDPHASLVWISVVFGSAVAAILYLLGTAMFSRRTGMAAALFAMTSPQCWFHSCVALTYMVDGFFVCLFVLSCWCAVKKGGRWQDTVLIGWLLAVVGGIRQQTVVGLLPLILFTFWSFGSQRAAKLAVAAGISVVVAMAWFIPMVELSGGLLQYFQVINRYRGFQARQTAAGGGWDAFTWNVFFVALFCWIGLLLAALLIGGGLLYRTFKIAVSRKQIWDRENAQALCMLGLWIGPMVFLGTAVAFTNQPGHVVNYLLGLLLLAGLVVAQLQRNWAFVLTVGLTCAVNVSAFVAWPRNWNGVMFSVMRTAREIEKHDRQLGRTIGLIRSGFDPSRTILCHTGENLLFGLRIFQLYSPEFDQYEIEVDPSMIAPVGRPLLSVRGGRVEFAEKVEVTGKRLILLVVPPGQNVNQFARYCDVSRAEPVQGSGGILYSFPVSGQLSQAAENADRQLRK